MQAVLEDALGLLVGAPVATTCAGRTDAGVHARGQVCHADVPVGCEPAALRRRLAALLPPDVRVRAVAVVPDAFDARFSALWRRYAYRVCDDPPSLDPLRRHEVLGWPRPLDPAAMNDAAGALLGEHDFAAFCRPRSGGTTVRELRVFRWRRDSPGVVVADVVADAFCQQMVRALVGALLVVGDGRRPPDWPAQLLGSRTRNSAVIVVPPHGLVLEEVGYPPDELLADRASQSRRVRELHE